MAKSWSDTFSYAGLAEVERNARWAGQWAAEDGDRHALHFDHTDNNANLHAAGATVLAHENTKTRHGRATRQCAFGFAPSGIACGCFAAADIQHQPKLQATVKS